MQYCAEIIVDLVSLWLTCQGEGFEKRMRITGPKAGYELVSGTYTLTEDSFLLNPIATYGGKRVNVGQYVICIDNPRQTCFHKLVPGRRLGQRKSHGCVNMGAADAEWLWWHSLPGTEVTIIGRNNS